ncbi:hypothetical protein B9Z65_4084 [Elsinoe australis]|uniref:FAD/NAD(P)-binding domain-containing protein n=1 Tax=Elsinoe australis TaxID=40998 RepID=A0A2P7Z1S4_9PEZI|nr:hypothetical protein B9Z65_4084 [Elsinoe australis]
MSPTTPVPYDVMVIGGGPAGLSAALGLARHLWRVLVIDSGSYRNDVATYMHNVAGWDHVPPSEFRTATRKQILGRYDTVEFADGAEVTGVEKFHCLFCHGYEESGADSAGVLAMDMLASVHHATMVCRFAARLAKRVTVYTNGNEGLAKTLGGSFGGQPISVDARKVVRLEKAKSRPGIVLHFDDGIEKEERFLAHAPKTALRGPFVEDLALERSEQGDLKVFAPFNKTSVQGVFAAGDCSTFMKSVAQAMLHGSLVAAGASAELGAET